jgi:hypothetical protein
MLAGVNTPEAKNEVGQLKDKFEECAVMVKTAPAVVHPLNLSRFKTSAQATDIASYFEEQVCMYVCVCECMQMYLCMYVCVCVCMYVCLYVCMYVCMCVCIEYVCMYVCINVCMYVCMCWAAAAARNALPDETAA